MARKKEQKVEEEEERTNNNNGFSPRYKQISGITSFDNQARNDENNKIIRVIYSFHLVISFLFMHCLLLYLSRWYFGVVAVFFQHFIIFFYMSAAVAEQQKQCVVNVQPQITLIILSPFFSLTLRDIEQERYGRDNTSFTLAAPTAAILLLVPRARINNEKNNSAQLL